MINRLGRISAAMTLIMALVAFIIVLLRYVFNLGWVSLQEVVIYLHAGAFILAMPYALKHDAHVRVDVLYEKMSEKQRAVTQIIGLFLLYFPLFGMLFYECFPYVKDSWSVFETSADAGGLPILFLLKSLLLVLPVLMYIQGFVWLKSAIGVLRTK